jgi:fluoride exporter
MKTALFVAMGGCCGALCRWGMGNWVDQLRGSSTSFPLGIFLVNILGCLLFGVFFGLGETRGWMSENLRLLIFTGFLGSFTTFSTFSWNTLELLKSGQTGLAFLNITLSLLVGLLSVAGGYSLAVKMG